MLDKAKEFAARSLALTRRAASGAAAKVIELADLNKDGKADASDARIAAEQTKEFASDAGQIRESWKGNPEEQHGEGRNYRSGHRGSDAVPLPVIGPVMGAAIGAALGAVTNLTTKRSTTISTKAADEMPLDVHAEILKSDDLRQRGLLTDAEFEKQKRSILAKGRA